MTNTSIMTRIALMAASVLLDTQIAKADPLSLVCKGDINLFHNGAGTIPETGAIVDLDRMIFTAPVYGTFPIRSIDATSITFGRDNQTVSVFGTLDRVSGHLVMNLMPPKERKNLSEGRGAKFTAYVDAKCTTTRKLF